MCVCVCVCVCVSKGEAFRFCTVVATQASKQKNVPICKFSLCVFRLALSRAWYPMQTFVSSSSPFPSARREGGWRIQKKKERRGDAPRGRASLLFSFVLSFPCSTYNAGDAEENGKEAGAAVHASAVAHGARSVWGRSDCAAVVQKGEGMGSTRVKFRQERSVAVRRASQATHARTLDNRDGGGALVGGKGQLARPG